MKPRIALLVDGDNVPALHAATILATARSLGQVDILRCYLNAQKSSSWLTQPEFRPIHAGCGKNASDLLLAIDAMELALGGRVGGFVIASSDSDFNHLAHRLREKGLLVHGLGEQKTPPAFRAACSGFTQLGQAAAQPALAVATSGPEPVSKAPVNLEMAIRHVIAAHSKQGKGMKLTELAPKMHQTHGIRISAQQEKTWRAYFLARPHLFDIDPRGADCHVRYRPEGFAGLAH